MPINLDFLGAYLNRDFGGQPAPRQVLTPVSDVTATGLQHWRGCKGFPLLPPSLPPPHSSG